MQMKKSTRMLVLLVMLALLVQACNVPGRSQSAEPAEPAPSPIVEPSTVAPPTESSSIQHYLIPTSGLDSKPYPDVVSSDTAPEKRAPYGDSYDLNRLERPFTQDMTYIPDLDITLFSLSEDDEFYYVSIGLVGNDPNNPIGINYAVELDINRDGFGDFIIVASPPYSNDWSAQNIKVYSDTNTNTAGESATKSDAPFESDGYDELIHDLAAGVGGDPDLAWVRIDAGPLAKVQFAFKKYLAGSAFMYGVLADAGLKDVSKLDYVDHFSEREAGSPIRRNSYYPLQALYAIDNTCFQAFGFNPTGFEPKLCPEIVQPLPVVDRERIPNTPEVDACTAIGQPNPGTCSYGWWDYPWCMCGIG
jgi:hypothetical protein